MENVPLTSENPASKTEKSKSDKDKKEKADKNSRQADQELAGKVALFGERRPKKDGTASKEKEPEEPSLWEKLKQQAEPEQVQEASEEEAPGDGSFSPEEAQEAPALVAGRLGEQVKVPEGKTPEAAAALAAKELYDRIEHGEKMDEAAADIVQEIGGSEQEVAAAKAAPEAAPKDEKDESVPAEQSEEPDVEAETEAQEAPGEIVTEEVVFDRLAEAGPADAKEEDEDEPLAAQPAPASGQPPAGGSGGSTPPRGPVPPGGASAAGPNFHFQPAPHWTPNIAPAPADPNQPATAERYDDRASPAVMALFGGIIGYYIGRRRGRIRAEKQAAKVQRKLEKQIDDIQWQLRTKEQQVRRVAAEKVRRDGYVVIEPLAARQAAKAAKTETKPAAKAVTRNAEPMLEARQKAAEAKLLHVPLKAHEHLGRMMLTSESARPAQRPEAAKPAKLESLKQEQIPEKLRERHVETLNRSELLTLSEKIVVDGTSLRQIYETHLIGERGLRRLVAEHLRGGDVKKILRQEIIEHEIDFERDPVLRDLPGPTNPPARPQPAASKATLDKLVAKASAEMGDGQEALAYYKARAAYEAQEQQEQAGKRNLVDIGLITAVVGLAVAVAVLYLTRH